MEMAVLFYGKQQQTTVSRFLIWTYMSVCLSSALSVFVEITATAKRDLKKYHGKVAKSNNGQVLGCIRGMKNA